MSDDKLIRVNAMLSVKTLSILDEYAALVGVSRSALIRGLVSEAEPALRLLLNKLKGFEHMSEGERAAALARLTKVSEVLGDGVIRGVDAL